MTRVQLSFWKSIDNHNLSIERRTGRLKELINKKIRDEPTQLNHSDLRLRARWCNKEISEFRVTIKSLQVVPVVLCV